MMKYGNVCHAAATPKMDAITITIASNRRRQENPRNHSNKLNIYTHIKPDTLLLFF